MKDLRRAREQHHQAWTNEMIDLETILARDNLNKAYKAVVGNKGSSGIDGMEVGDLLDHLKLHGADLIEDIKAGRYRPSAVRRSSRIHPQGERKEETSRNSYCGRQVRTTGAGPGAECGIRDRIS